MKYILFFILFYFNFSYSQDKNKQDNPKSLIKTEAQKAKELARKAPISLYKIYTIQKDTILVDTTLTIKKEYDYNYLRKDNFGLLPFSNEGQPYTTLDFGLRKFSAYPEFGYIGKQFAYLGVNDIKYYSVPTPITQLYFKTVMEQGQNVDALISVNTSKQFNFSIAFKGLRSLGKYINQLSSTGNFRFTTSYFTKNEKYHINFHFTGQDILNGENGGLTNVEDFENGDKAFDNRARLQVYFKDAKTLLKGKRFFVDHNLRINSNDAENNLYLSHQFIYEHKFFEFNQVTEASTNNNSTLTFNRFGNAFVSGNIIDQSFNDKTYNKVGLVFENKTLGKFQFFAENFIYNYNFSNPFTVVSTGNTSEIYAINTLKGSINSVGGEYNYQKKNWKGVFTYSNSVSKQAMRNLDAFITYKVDSKTNFSFQYQNISKLPNFNYLLNQSSYFSYNWVNNFKNEKINTISAIANTKWLNVAVKFTTLNDYLYFADTSDNIIYQFVSPKQFANTISYVSLKLGREFKFRKWALDNTFLYQTVAQDEAILNVPKYTTRNMLYYSNHFFKRALYIQTGIILNYFSKYYQSDYNPIVGDFFIQNKKLIGDFPMLDFFVNGRIRQTRIYLKAEHFNSSFTGNKFYATPTSPYHDFIIRFGLVWDFFQ
ncbi:MAG: putative porin [Flavobacterium sp.]|nr:putative porin [Flavobacterium sp.]